MAVYDKLTSAIYNDIVSGLRGYTTNISLSLEQLADDIADERLAVIRELYLKGVIPKKDLFLTIPCIDVDCKSIDKCWCGEQTEFEDATAHFEIPQLIPDFGKDSIEYLGSTDFRYPFQVYTDMTSWLYSKYRKRFSKTPAVFINTTPNENGMYDC